MKANPLFVDSTKFQGDTIRTDIEVKGVSLPDTWTLQMNLTEEGGQNHIIALQQIPSGAFVGRAWLKHQQSLTYCYEIKDGERLHMASPLREIRASYLIIDEWTPELGVDAPTES